MRVEPKELVLAQPFRPLLLALGLLMYLLAWALLLAWQQREAQAQAFFYAENMPILIELSDTATEAQISALQSELGTADYVLPKSLRYVSRTEAKAVLGADLSEADLAVFSDSLLPNLLEFRFKPSHLAGLADWGLEWRGRTGVADLYLPDHSWFEPRTYDVSWWWFLVGVLFLATAAVTWVLWQGALSRVWGSDLALWQGLWVVGASSRFFAEYLNRLIWLILLGLVFLWGGGLWLSWLALRWLWEPSLLYCSWGVVLLLHLGLVFMVAVLLFWGARHFMRGRLGGFFA